MRRSDREVTDDDRINQVIMDCHCCRLGFWDGAEVYVVPLNFGFEHRNGERILYFHSAKTGRKIDLIRETQSAGFEMDTNYRLNEGEIACEYSARFLSVIGNGKVELLEDPVQKEAALQVIMFHSTGKRDWEFQEKMLNAVSIFRLTVTKISCKEHL